MKSTLTPRELQVLTLAAEGHRSQVIADILKLSKRSIDFHLNNVFQKLKVSNRMQAVNKARMLGLMEKVMP